MPIISLLDRYDCTWFTESGYRDSKGYLTCPRLHTSTWKRGWFPMQAGLHPMKSREMIRYVACREYSIMMWNWCHGASSTSCEIGCHHEGGCARVDSYPISGSVCAAAVCPSTSLTSAPGIPLEPTGCPHRLPSHSLNWAFATQQPEWSFLKFRVQFTYGEMHITQVCKLMKFWQMYTLA